TDDTTLRSMGMTRAQRAGANLCTVVPIALGGAVAAVLVAAALSPLAPIGLARVAEPHPGFAFDTVRLLGGGALLAVVAVAIGGLLAWHTSRNDAADAGPERRSALAALVGRVSGRPAMSAGLKLGLEAGRGRTSVPIRTTVA